MSQPAKSALQSVPARRTGSAPVERRLFGTDGVRGVANVHPMTAEVALQLGRALAHHVRNGSHRHRIVIGKDTRLSGYLLEQAIASGILLDGRRRGAVRAAAHPGHRLHHPVDARRRRGGDQRQPQPLPGQRHQVLLARRVQAPRRGGGEDRALRLRRGRGRRGPQRRLQGHAPHRQPHRQGEAHRRCRRALRGLPEGALPARAHPRRRHRGGRLRQRRRLSRGAGRLRGAGREGGLPGSSARREEHQRQLRRRPPGGDGPRGEEERGADRDRPRRRRRPRHRRGRARAHRRRRRHHGHRRPRHRSGRSCSPRRRWSPR